MEIIVEQVNHLLAQVNKTKEQDNCTACAIAVDRMLAAGNWQPVEAGKNTPPLVTDPMIDEAGSIHRSFINDPRFRRTGNVSSMNVDEPRIVTDLCFAEKVVFDITGEIDSDSESLIKFNNPEQLSEELVNYACRRKGPVGNILESGTAYGYIILTHVGELKGHIINFYIDTQDRLWFMDSQAADDNGNYIHEEINLEGYTRDVFWLQVEPPDGFIPVVKPELDDDETFLCDGTQSRLQTRSSLRVKRELSNNDPTNSQGDESVSLQNQPKKRRVTRDVNVEKYGRAPLESDQSEEAKQDEIIKPKRLSDKRRRRSKFVETESGRLTELEGVALEKAIKPVLS